jgi:hypothetical protein
LNDVFDLYELDIIKRLKDPFNRIWHLMFWRAEIGQIPLQDLSASAIRSPREKWGARIARSRLWQTQRCFRSFFWQHRWYQEDTSSKENKAQQEIVAGQFG